MKVELIHKYLDLIKARIQRDNVKREQKLQKFHQIQKGIENR